MRASRLLTILLTLQARGRATAPSLAEELEVSVRTVLRDIDELSASGVPVYAERGREGGFRLLEGYRVKLNGLTSLEAEALALANLPGPATDLGLGEAVLGAHLKIIAALPENQRKSADRTMSRFHLDPTGWYQAPDPVPHLPALARAVWEGEEVRMTYRSWKADVQRTASPLGLVLKGGLWYLVARVGTDIRNFRVGNILSLTTTGKAIRTPRGFNLATHWETSSKRFERELYSRSATLLVSAEGFRRVCQLPAMISDAARASAGRPDRKGWREVTIPIESGDNAVGEILKLADHAIVLAPDTLAQEVIDAAERTAHAYARRAQRKRAS